MAKVRKKQFIDSGRRLRRAREALNFPKAVKFAELMGVTKDNLSNWERGISEVPTDFVLKLRAMFGVDHNWVYGGDPSGLRAELRDKLLSEEQFKR